MPTKLVSGIFFFIFVPTPPFFWGLVILEKYDLYLYHYCLTFKENC